MACASLRSIFLSKLSQFGSRSAAIALYALKNKIGFILVYPIRKTPLLRMGPLRLKLDPFHAMQRLSKLVLKSHGACGAYMARLRDALFMVHSEDLAAVEAALRLLGKTPEEIEEKKKPTGRTSFRGAAGTTIRRMRSSDV